MQTRNRFTKKSAKALTASALGITLLLGGSTYALWSANAPVNSESTISSGDLQVTAAAPQKWWDVTNPEAPMEIAVTEDHLLVPGDALELEQELNAVVIGNNISGVLKLLVPNTTESSEMLSQAKFTLSLYDSEQEQLGSVTPEVNNLESLKLEVGNLKPTDAAGDLYKVKIRVELPSTADNNTKIRMASLSNMSVVLEQGEKYVAPEIPIYSQDFESYRAGQAMPGMRYEYNVYQFQVKVVEDSGNKALEFGRVYSNSVAVLPTGIVVEPGIYRVSAKIQGSTAMKAVYRVSAIGADILLPGDSEVIITVKEPTPLNISFSYVSGTYSTNSFTVDNVQVTKIG